MRRRSKSGSVLVFIATVSTCAATLTMTTAASAQTPEPRAEWKGVYVGVTAGASFQRDDADEIVEFDTDLNGTFDDTVRTVAGADAFSPGFCAGSL